MKRKERKKGLVSASLLVLAVVLLMAACSNNSGKNTESEHASTQTPAATSQPAGNDEPASTQESYDPFGKYDPPITVTSVRFETEGIKYPPGSDIDNNVWTKAWQDDLGINLKNDWVVSSQQFEQKMNVSIVSGELPDLYLVDARQLKMLVDSNKLQDSTDVYNQYASPLLKQAMEENDSANLKASTFKGKLMAIPKGGVSVDNVPMLWIRQDWLEKLKLPEPKTPEDVIAIMEAFANDDPDGNGEKDTFGMNLTKDIYSNYSGVEGYFSMFGAYPYNNPKQVTMWLEKGGKLAYGSIQPEVKTALEKLQQLYKDGVIDPEFAVYDGSKAAENEMSGKTGLHFGVFSNTGWPLRDFKKQNPDGDWRPYPIPGPSGVNLVPVQAVTPAQYYVVNANAKNPEALIKLLNYYFLKVVDPKTQETEKFHSATIGDTVYTMFQYSVVQGGLTSGNQTDFEQINKALDGSLDASKLTSGQKGIYDAILGYRDGDPALWFRETQFGPKGALAVLGQYKKADSFIYNQFSGSPTKTMVTKGSTLTDLEVQMMTRVIMGSDISEFDKFVSDWKSLGGDAITQEVNEWYQNK